MSPTEHVWDALDTTRIRYVYDHVFQFLPISSVFAHPLKRSGPTHHRPQSTTWSTLCKGDVRQMVVTPDTNWFSDPPPPIKQNCTFQSGLLLRHTCAIFLLSNQHLDMPHLLGGMDYLGKREVLTNTDLDRFVNNI